jgi:MinD-like ATPase involved in chromosome partitioning or flagellar assembly
VPGQPPADRPAAGPQPADPQAVLVRRPPGHGDPLARRVGRLARRLAGTSAAGEVEQATLVAHQLQQPVTTGRRIAVVSIRGGAGKTTVAALLGTAFAHYRHDRVLVLEADVGLGTLPARLGVHQVRRTVGELAGTVTASAPFETIAEHLLPLPGGGWLLAGSRGQVGAQLDPAAYPALAVTLSRFFAVTVVDCDTLPGELARGALADAHARALVTPATVEGVVTARTVLDWLAGLGRPELLAGTVVTLVAGTPHTVVDVEEAAALLAVGGAGVLAVPYDRHLAAGGPIEATRLAAGTREATTRLAADLLTRAMRR